MTTSRQIRVLIVDDSAFFCRMLADLLGRDPDIHLIGTAKDPYEARDTLRVAEVDVLLLDMEMPRMDGLTFLKLIMNSRPMPVIVMSSLTPSGSRTAIDALLAGAFEVLGKPENFLQKQLFERKLLENIKVAAAAPPRKRIHKSQSLVPVRRRPNSYHPRQIIAMGASTGGTNALKEVLMGLPATLPGIAVVQHIPPKFSASFARRMNLSCAMEVREALDGDILHSGLALIAPGGYHMEVAWRVDHYQVALHSGPQVEHQRPSVDVLFDSLAQSAGSHAVAALLTGMGKDGAAGMKRMHDLGAHTIAQNEETCVVYGMPRKAVECGAVDVVAPLESIAGELMKALETQTGLLATTSS